MARTLRLAGALGALALSAGQQNPHPDMGGYRPASNVVEHAQMVFDIKDITTAANAEDWAAAKEIYTNGKFSCKSTAQARTFQGFVNQATYDNKLQGKAFMDSFAGGAGDNIPGAGRLALAGTFWDDMMLAALDGTGDFAQLDIGNRDTMRKTFVKKGILGILTMYSAYELESAISKARDGNFADSSGAPHAWDEGWAFYYGSYGSHESTPLASNRGKYSAWEFAKKRDLDYAYNSNNERIAEAVDSREVIVDYFRKGLRASRDDTSGDAVQEMLEARDDIYRLFALASIRAALKYAEKTQAEGYNEEYHMEAYAYFLAAAGWVEQAAMGVGASVLDLLDFKKTSSQLNPNLYCAVKAALIPAYEPLGLDCAMVGEWKDHDAALDASCTSVPACPNATALPAGLSAYSFDTDTSAGTNTDCGVPLIEPEAEPSAARATATGAALAWLLMAALMRAA